MFNYLVAGSSGATGSKVIRDLLEREDTEKVISLTRSPVYLRHPKLKQVVCEFRLLSSSVIAERIDRAFFCLGNSTLACSNEERRVVNYEYAARVADIVMRKGARKFSYISSVGASSLSPFSYLRIKGTAENMLVNMGFEQLDIFRPSVLKAERKEERKVDDLLNASMDMLSPLLKGNVLSRLTPVDVADLAKSMIDASNQDKKGNNIYYYDEIMSLIKEG